MRQSLRAGSLLLVLGSTTPITAAAQSDRTYEVGIQGLLLLQDPRWIGGGGYGAWRPGGHARFALTVEGGSLEDQFSGRGELLAHFVLSPRRTGGVGVYGLGGIAGEVGPRDQGYLVLGLGLEHAPGAGSGWAVEAGVGGGFRLSVGWRWRGPAQPKKP